MVHIPGAKKFPPLSLSTQEGAVVGPSMMTANSEGLGMDELEGLWEVVGIPEGSVDGIRVVDGCIDVDGPEVGKVVGTSEGTEDGTRVVDGVIDADGPKVGTVVGMMDGAEDGTTLGRADNAEVGAVDGGILL